ncbi:hypothetical protein DPEC_G00078600 [Dallia pectoralis]|uniref:Uncharacterized protein n=1 Tax=Dallia pectoralis TaxID=75939 RepID=A0ACC2H4S8_DALPE|nr:hypothetical protein DPEC_G00078600 [Dallia pectoralis]
MEIQKCIVRGCANKSDAIIHYNLPEDPQRREQWMRFLRESNPGAQIPYVSRLCGAHFTGECFTKLDLGFTTKLILNLDAVPTVYSTDKTSAHRQHIVSPEGRKETEMLEVKTFGIKEPDSQVNCWSNLFNSISDSISSIKEEDVDDDKSIAESYDQVRVVQVEYLFNGDGWEERQEEMKPTEHEGELEVFVIENSNTEEDGWRECVVAGEKEERRIDQGGGRRTEKAEERRLDGMCVKRSGKEKHLLPQWWGHEPKRKKRRLRPQWWGYEPPGKKTKEDEWKMIAERAKEEERERRNGQAVKEKKREAGFRCPQCSSTFQSRSDMLEHKTSCGGDPGSTSSVLLGRKHCPPGKTQRHRWKTKTVGVQSSHRKTFFCPLCNTYYKNQGFLDKHIRGHINQCNVTVPCYFCSLEFPGRSEMRDHYNTEHPGQVPRCEQCGIGSATLNKFLIHQARHLNVTPFHCYECNIYHTTQRGLDIHLSNHALKCYLAHSASLNKPDKTGSCGAAHLNKATNLFPNNPDREKTNI